jgi:protoporphyrinogen oxidase
VLGLTAALRLLERGHQVTVYERERLPGGLAAGFQVAAPTVTDEATDQAAGQDSAATGAVWLEKFYHHLFQSDTAAIHLIEELGLGNRLEWHRPRTDTLWQGIAYPLDSPLTLLRFRPLPLLARLRTAAALAYLRIALRTPNRLEGQTAAPWIRRVMGESSYQVVWGPLLKSKFGAVADEIALPWFWGRIHDRTTVLGYVRGGFQLFYNRLAARIRARGGTILLDTRIERVETAPDGGFQVHHAPTGTPDGAPSQARHHERVISTLPTRLTCRLVPQLPGDYRARYDWGRAYGAHCVILALDRPLTQTYWLNINDPGYPFMALVEHTNYMPLADYGGQHLIYLGNYRAMDDPLFQQSKSEVLDAFLPHLTRINPAFDPSWVTRSWVFAAPFAQPIVTTDYRAHIPPFDTPLSGFSVANMFQVYPHDRGQNYSIDLAERLVRHLEGE